ncbi:hypothetical protein U9M48_043020 [Paspalum notatum var. saurae]|uniref:Transposase n=1 Tax=Paspalum notatum var. saurae TaxID=547442 RepID=A0AAQ3UWE4_PASNO
MLTGADGKVCLENYVFDQDVARKELALMICLHEYPLALVDHAGFRKFCAAMQPLFKVPSRNTIRTNIMDMHAVQRESILSSRVAIITDMWTANHQKKGYMAVIAHFIDDKWELKIFLLRFIYVPAPHTAEVIADVLHGVLVDCHLERKVSTMTLDNCSTNDSMMLKMQDKLPLECLMLEGLLLHMRCAAHILNLIVRDGMSIMEKGTEKVRDSVGFWCATPKRHEKFKKMASQLNIAYIKRIGLDCTTRWNSTYAMLSTALEYQAVFERLALQVCARLKLFYDISELLCGTKYVTANLFFPKICGVYLAIRKWRASGHPRIEEMPALMKEKFDKYWKDVHGLMAVAAVLDPRFKLQMLQAFFTSVYGVEQAAFEVERIRGLMYQLVIQYQHAAKDVATSAGGKNGIGAVMAGSGDDDEYMSSQPSQSSSHVRTELDLYLDEPPLPRTQEIDIINWWKYGGIKYPTLQSIARDILPIPVTTVASESAFSTSGRVISPHRSRLAPKMIEALMCMQAWSHADMLGKHFLKELLIWHSILIYISTVKYSACIYFIVGDPTRAAVMTCMEEEEEKMTVAALLNVVWLYLLPPRVPIGDRGLNGDGDGVYRGRGGDWFSGIGAGLGSASSAPPRPVATLSHPCAGRGVIGRSRGRADDGSPELALQRRCGCWCPAHTGSRYDRSGFGVGGMRGWRSRTGTGGGDADAAASFFDLEFAVRDKL